MRVPTRPPVRTGSPTAHTHPSGAPDSELDVRDDLRNRREPFSRIMAAVGSLPVDGVLHLRATFEPVPLFAVLGRQGFVHETLEHAEDDWSVWFWRDEPHGETTALGARSLAPGVEQGTGEASPDIAEAAATGHLPGDVFLDVRGLEPPEPMARTLAALEALAPGLTLVQVNVRVPQFLLPILAERGFVHEIDDSVADRVLVRIRCGG